MTASKALNGIGKDDDKVLHDRGMKLRIDMLGWDVVEIRMNAFDEFCKPA